MMRSLAFTFLFFLAIAAQSQTPDLVLPVGHTIKPRFVSFSPDGKYIATATGEDNDHTIFIWEAATGRLLQNFIGFSFDARGMRFMKDGQHFFTHDNFMSVLDLATRQRKKYFDTIPAENIGISDDEEWLAFQPRLGYKYLDSVCIYSMQTGKMKNIFYSEGLAIEALAFSPDNKYIATFTPYPNFVTKYEAEKDSSYIILWNIETGKKQWTTKVEREPFGTLKFSRDGNFIYDYSNQQLFDAKTGALLDIESELFSGRRIVHDFSVSKNLLVIEKDEELVLVDAITKKITHTLPIEKESMRANFSDNASILTIDYYDKKKPASIWDVNTGKKIGDYLSPPDNDFYSIDNLYESPDGKHLAMPQENGQVSIRRKQDFKEQATLNNYTNDIVEIQPSKDSSKLFIVDKSARLRVTDAKSGRVIHSMQLLNEGSTNKVLFTPDEKKAIAIGYDTTLSVWDINTAIRLYQLRGIEYNFFNAAIHPSGNFFVTWEAIGDRLAFHELTTGKLKSQLIIPESKEGTYNLEDLIFSDDGKFLFFQIANTIQIREAYTGKLLRSITTPSKGSISKFTISPNQKLLAAAIDSVAFVWDIQTGKKISTLIPKWPAYLKTSNLPSFRFIKFGPDSKQIIAGCYNDNAAKLYDVNSGKLIHLFDSTDCTEIADAWFIENGKKIVVREKDNLLWGWDVSKGQPIEKIGTTGEGGLSAVSMAADSKGLYMAYGSRLFTFKHWNKGSIYQSVFINEKDWLVADGQSRFDGTDAARKLLYFVCGNEPIDLEQVKEQLWVPGLAERLNTEDTITSKGISDLQICGYIPQVEDKTRDKSTYQFQITPRTGGLGDVIVQVNGIEVKRMKPAELEKAGNQYQLNVPTSSIKDFLIAGQDNKITVKALTADNSISSRGVDIDEEVKDSTLTPPNLFAVVVGVSDYKGDDLDLKYASKDANDIAAAIKQAAQKLLNTDSEEHVFVYNLTTDEKKYKRPEKENIKSLLQEIGTKAKANDVLLLFFAGHGVMQANKEGQNQFYFLTADASTLSAGSAVGDVGISTNELTEWMKPQNIKAQKRVLVFDACNSGQAIKDFVKMGNNNDYLAARNDDKAQQIKAIDKLNEKSGLFILSASASNQSAYELGRYSQGLLTYSLLKAIKEQPDILENGKYLNVSRWFSAAEKTVSELAKETGARQEPQLVSTTNFNIGLVDDEVIASINLPEEKPIFAASNFQNSDEAIADDDLELNRSVNLSLTDLSSRNISNGIMYVTATNSPSAYTLSGRYAVKGNLITVSINLKQNKIIKHRFELSGTKDKIDELAAAITAKAISLIK